MQNLWSVIALPLILCHSSISFATDDRLTFFSSNRYAQSTLSSAEENGDTRNFNAEALFIESSSRINRPLTDTEKKQIARIKTAAETFNLIRYRFSNEALIDFSFKRRKIDNAQLTHFFSTNEVNDVELVEYGLAYQHSWRTKEADFVLRSSYRRSERIGLIEFLPNYTDDVDTLELNVAYTLIGTNDKRLTIYYTYAYQDIELNIAEPYDRSREIGAFAFVVGGTGSPCRECMGDKTLLSSRSNPVIPSSMENIFARQYDYTEAGVHGGYAYDKEEYASVEVTRTDVYVGFTSILGKMRLTVEPALFTSEVSDDESQTSRIFRLSLISAFDHVFKRRVKLAIPLIYDKAREGPDYFDSWRIGLELSRVFFVGRNSQSKMLLAAGFMHKEYLNIDHNDSLWSFTVALSI